MHTKPPSRVHIAPSLNLRTAQLAAQMLPNYRTLTVQKLHRAGARSPAIAVRLNDMNLTEQQLERIADICSSNGVRTLAAFGSRARGDGRAESDLDLLVEFEPGKTPGFLGIAHLAGLLSEELGGVEVDLRTKRDLSRHFREEVVRSAEVIYSC